MLTRRRFFQALAASALAAGVPLPVGFPEQPMTATEAQERQTLMDWDLHAFIRSTTGGIHGYAKKGTSLVVFSHEGPDTFGKQS